MDKKKDSPSMPSSGTPEAEEFMALLLSSQKTDHDCMWSRYFKKMGDRMVKQYTGDVKNNE